MLVFRKAAASNAGLFLSVADAPATVKSLPEERGAFYKKASGRTENIEGSLLQAQGVGKEGPDEA